MPWQIVTLVAPSENINVGNRIINIRNVEIIKIDQNGGLNFIEKQPISISKDGFTISEYLEEPMGEEGDAGMDGPEGLDEKETMVSSKDREVDGIKPKYEPDYSQNIYFVHIRKGEK